MHDENDISVQNFVKRKAIEKKIRENFESVGKFCYNIQRDSKR